MRALRRPIPCGYSPGANLRGRDRVVARHVAVEFGGFTEGMARVERRNICCGDIWALGEFSGQPIDRRLPVAAVHPIDQAQRPKILRAQRFFLTEAGTP